MKLLVDMNLSPDWVGFLAEAGFESIHWSKVGPANADDREVLRWADKRGYVLLTADLDFGAILAATQGIGPSVVQLRSDDLSPVAIGNATVLALRQAEEDLRAGAIMVIDVAGARLRILPLPG